MLNEKMAATGSAPVFSVLTSSNESNDDFLNQLRTQLNQIETNLQETLTKIQQRPSFSFINEKKNEEINEKTRFRFFDVLKDLANRNHSEFNEKLFREQIFDEKKSSLSTKKDLEKNRISATNDNPSQHLSPLNNARRSQFAPVLSSTPVHQTSPVMSNPVDSNVGTPSVAPVLVINSRDLPVVPPSAIVPQRANRPGRMARAGSSTRQKKNPSPIKERENESELILNEEIEIVTRHQIESKEIFIEQNIEIIKTVQATPLRARKKKQIQAEPEPERIPEENQIVTKTSTQSGRSKKKEKASSTLSERTTRQRKKEETETPIESIPTSPQKKTTRSRKKTEPKTEQVESTPKIRATSARGKKKSNIEVEEKARSISPKTNPTRSKKRKEKDETNPTPIDSIQPPSPKRRGRRAKKSEDLPTTTPVETVQQPAQEEPTTAPATIIVPRRTSRRGKKDIEVVEEKQEPVVLKKKTRSARSKKAEESPPIEIPVTIVEPPVTSIPTIPTNIPSSKSMDSLVKKPPRPPVARKKKSIAMPPISQNSPTTPPKSAQRIESTSPINDQPILPLPVVGSRRRGGLRRDISSPVINDPIIADLPPTSQNKKRSRSSVAETPKRARRENILATNILGTPGKKRSRCTCEKRTNRICDICAAAIEN